MKEKKLKKQKQKQTKKKHKTKQEKEKEIKKNAAVTQNHFIYSSTISKQNK